MNIGIVGAEAAKFTPTTEAAAIEIIKSLCTPGSTIVSGRCHLGGIDVWAENIAIQLQLSTQIFPPKELNWARGYKPRNLQIARASDQVHVIVVETLPPDYYGMRFKSCYHCGAKRWAHVKSGACWTAIQAQRMGKPAFWHIIAADGRLLDNV